MEEIKLYDHNEEGYQSIIKSLEDSNFSFIERATGTGKSYILIKYLATQMAGKRVLFVTTHEPMFDQLVNRDMPLLGTSKEIYDKLGRTTTTIKGKGLISGEKEVLYCVLTRIEVFELKRIVEEMDESAFVTITDVSDIIGNHIKSNNKIKKLS